MLNLDGPKFQFLFAEIVKSFMKAAADALGKGNEVNLNKIKEQVDYQIKAAMPEFRRGIETIGLTQERIRRRGMLQKIDLNDRSDARLRAYRQVNWNKPVCKHRDLEADIRRGW